MISQMIKEIGSGLLLGDIGISLTELIKLSLSIDTWHQMKILNAKLQTKSATWIEILGKVKHELINTHVSSSESSKWWRAFNNILC